MNKTQARKMAKELLLRITARRSKSECFTQCGGWGWTGAIQYGKLVRWFRVSYKTEPMYGLYLTVIRRTARGARMARKFNAAA